MCGRSRVSLAPERVQQLTGVPAERWVDRDRYHPSHNVSPGGWTPILRLDEQQAPLLQTMKWGLVPSFTKPGSHLDFYRQFNARSESVAEKPVFSRLLSRHRCVVLLEGFYEWKADAGGKKQPYYISLVEQPVIHMAGLYDVYEGGADGPLATYTILTTDSSQRLSWLHDRMPVLLETEEAVQQWLNGKGSNAQAAPLDICGPCNSESIVWHPVTPAMSKPGYQNPDAATDIRKKKGAITSFFKAAPSPAKPKAAAAAAKGIKPQETPSPAKPKAAVQQQGPVKQEDGSSKEQQKQQASAVRNPDEEAGPTAAEEEAAKEQLLQQSAAKAGGSESAAAESRGSQDAAAAAAAAVPSKRHHSAGVEPVASPWRKKRRAGS